ncbi:hypothetical protein CSA08_04315 [Candidatus Gracilibacteria bacterium]|nr:MAG: hypothetical protein CSA08_04315 [Candidatus Gracilibacteria bacterium]
MGLYLIFTSDDPRIIYDFKLTIGLGLFIPQISFFIFFIKSTFEVTKLFFTNTYYFFLTVYYKTLRLIHWFKNIPNNLKNFFKSKSSSYKEENSYSDYSSYEEDNNSSYSSDNYEEEYTKQEEKYSYDENNSYTEQENYENDNSYEKEYKSSYNKTEEDLEDNSNLEDNEYARFYSPSAYVVLGVNVDDDFKTIKKAYRELIRKYHPDKNPQDVKLYTEISQNINNAYEKLKKIH